MLNNISPCFFIDEIPSSSSIILLFPTSSHVIPKLNIFIAETYTIVEICIFIIRSALKNITTNIFICQSFIYEFIAKLKSTFWVLFNFSSQLKLFNFYSCASFFKFCFKSISISFTYFFFYSFRSTIN